MASDDDDMITLPNGNKVRNATECGNCGATGDDLKKCNKCHAEAYCSRGELMSFLCMLNEFFRRLNLLIYILTYYLSFEQSVRSLTGSNTN